MSNNVVTIRKETAQHYLPDALHSNGSIDLHKLATLAKQAIEGSDTSLAAASAIANGNFIERFIDSGAMQRHVIQSISYIRDISKVNLGLSAICNDLAAANLEHASRIDKNQHATEQQLRHIQQQTGDLLAYLTAPREPGLLEVLLPVLSKGSPKDKGEVHEWLRKLAKEIDQQYMVLKENVGKLSEQVDRTAGLVSLCNDQIYKNSEAFTSHSTDVNRQLGLLTSRVTESTSEASQRAEKLDSTIRKSHEVLAAALTTLNQQLAAHKSDFQNAIQTEKKERLEMLDSVTSLVSRREAALRRTIGELNQHLLKRMLWGAGGIVILQILGFGFLAFNMGLLN